MKEENKDYLTAQIITYIGNKRQLIRNIEEEVKKIAGLLGKEKLVCADIFSGSGIDLNSPANGVFLPYQKNEFVTTEVMHCGGHLNSYFDEVYERLNSIVYDAIEKECSDAQIQKLICNELQKIRRDLLNGLLKVHN